MKPGRAALACLLLAYGAFTGAQDFKGWTTYGGDEGNTHYSALAQLNRDNVSELELAWRYDSARGAPLPATSELQLNPIVVDGVLYGRNPLYNVFALDAATGQERWSYNPPLTHVGLSNMRGVTYWQGEGREHILFTTGHYLMALDARDGKPVKSFGSHGKVDLRIGLGRDPETVSINAPSPGVIYDTLIIMGSAVAESAGAAPGDIRAYSAIDGALVWTFHTIPYPGQTGHDTWPAGARDTAGGANAWAGMSVDRERGVVYVPTGSPTPDFDGSGRHGANLFGNSVIALDALSGKRLWHFQAVHHDLWDRDLSSAPTLATVTTADGKQDVVAQASKQGVLYLLDRDTGKPVFPIAEVPVPASDVPGEQAYPTQPSVTLPEPFTRQTFSVDDLSRINPDTHSYLKQQLQDTEEFAYLRPPGLNKSVLFPGFYGGANWGGGAFDPQSNLYYINAIEAPHIIQIQAVEVNKGSSAGRGAFLFRQQCSGCHGLEMQGFYPYAPALTGIAERSNKRDAMEVIRAGKGRMMPFPQLARHDLEALVDYVFAYDAGENITAPGAETETAYVFAGYNDFVDKRFYPAVEPPWGTLTAIDLATGKRAWQVTLGEYEELSKEGIPPTGTRNYGGPVVTAGGLLIIAATSDELLRIFDKKSGELLWQYKLPAAGYATPATYELDGRQYIVVTCSGGKLGTPTGDRYLAFALPQVKSIQEAAD